MKKTITKFLKIFVIVNLIIIIVWLLMPDPTAGLYDFRSLIEESKFDPSIKKINIAAPISYEEAGIQYSNIPFWIRYHPRRIFKASWKEDFIGLGYREGMFFSLGKNQNNRVDIYAYNIKKRICYVDIYNYPDNIDTQNLAHEVYKLIKDKYPRLLVQYKQYKVNKR